MKPPSPTSTAPHSGFLPAWLPHLAAAAALLGGLLLTALAVSAVEVSADENSRFEFDQYVNRMAGSVQDRLEHPMVTLRDLGGSWAALHARGGFREADFHRLMARRGMDTEFPGLQDLMYVERLSTAGQPDRYLVRYLAPTQDSVVVTGMDLAAQPVGRAAIEMAIASAQPALSGRIDLSTAEGLKSGLLLIYPVYRGNVDVPPQSQRGDAVAGLFVASIDVAELIRPVTDVARGAVEFALYDGSAMTPEGRLFSTADGIGQTSSGASDQAHRFEEQRAVVVGNAVLTLRSGSTPLFDLSRDTTTPWAIVAAGSLMSLLVAVVVWLLFAGRSRAELSARKMTAELDKLATIVRRTSNAVIMTTVDLRITWVNEAFTRMYGYSAEEAIGRTPSDLLSAANNPVESAQVLIDAARRGVGAKVEVLNRRRDGQERWFLVDVQPMRDENGALAGYIEIATDITEEKQASLLLIGSINALDEAFVIFDPDDRLVLCNQKYRDAFTLINDLLEPGMQFEDLVRQGAARGQYPDAIGCEEEWVQSRVALHRAANQTLLQHLPDGRILRVVERRLADGHTVGFRIDVTGLIRATQAAEEASRAKSQFLANMSHEIRTPMNAILGMLKLAQTTELTARQQDYLGKADSAARSLLGLINDVLDFSKIEAGRLELDLHPVRLDKLMRDLAVVLSANLAHVGNKNLEVLFDIDPDLPDVVMCDAMRLQQVLVNLGSNALKFTARGQVVIGLQALPAQAPDMARIAFSVEDSGIGIAPEHRERIFSGFTQAEGSTTRKYGGTGLGLVISKRLVQAMGADLDFTSAPGQGTRFFFTLDLALAHETADEAAVSAAATSQPVPLQDDTPMPARKVLVVDDNPLARQLLQRMVEPWSISLQVASSGEAALSLIAETAARRESPFELIFMDIRLEGMDGWETARRIRAMVASDGRQPVIIMVSGSSRDAQTERAQDESHLFDGFVTKPVTASMLLDALRQAASEEPPSRTLVPAVVQRPLTGIRVLVVEDNLINQQVAEELLSAQGAYVAMAANGQLGVDAVAAAQPQFDVVLMDVQMPVLDGFGATAAIRNRLGLQDLPIIGLTANALTSDRQDCLQAGMNEHVGKPFDIRQLAQLILRVCARVPAEGAPSAPGPRATVPASELPHRLPHDLPEVDLAPALERLSGIETLYMQAAMGFLKDLASLADRLDEHLATHAWEAAARLVHTCKGTCGTLGLTRLAADMAGLERTIKQARVGAAELSVTPLPLRERVVQAMQALQAVVGQMQSHQLVGRAPATPVALDRQAASNALVQLMGLLADSNMEAVQCYQVHRHTLTGLPRDRFDALDSAMHGLDFPQALQVCREAFTEL